jgi:hypothetical protein
VIILTSVSLLIAAYSIVSSNSFQKRQQSGMESSSQSIVEAVSILNKTASIDNKPSPPQAAGYW